MLVSPPPKAQHKLFCHNDSLLKKVFQPKLKPLKGHITLDLQMLSIFHSKLCVEFFYQYYQRNENENKKRLLLTLVLQIVFNVFTWMAQQMLRTISLKAQIPWQKLLYYNVQSVCPVEWGKVYMYETYILLYEWY